MPNGPVYVMPGQPQAGWGAPPARPAPQPQPQVAMPAPPAKLALPPAPTVAAQPPAPKVRAVAEDVPPRLTLPSPEALGITVVPAPQPVAVDWNQVHARLEQLGVVRYQRGAL